MSKTNTLFECLNFVCIILQNINFDAKLACNTYLGDISLETRALPINSFSISKNLQSVQIVSKARIISTYSVFFRLECLLRRYNTLGKGKTR